MNYVSTLKETFGFDNFREHQLEIVTAIIEQQKDVCIIMFTGAGKSLCYQFPAIYANKVSIVISPLISLSNDQAMKMKAIGVPVCCLNGTVKNKLSIKNKIFQNEFRLVYVTPEFIVKEEQFVKELALNDLLISVSLDEAHTLSSWSHDFREAYKELGCIKEWVPDVPVLALTATATSQVQNDIIKTLKLKSPLIIKTTFDRPNLIINVKHKTGEPLNDLLPVVKALEPTIIYCQKRKTTEKIAKLLSSNKIACESYHAGMGDIDRDNVHKRFSSNEVSCVSATIAFGMGIDINIRKVIHYGIPQDMESYYQEIGRAGRDGKISDCYLFYKSEDMSTNNFLISQITNTAYRAHKLQLANIMKDFVYSSTCRRKAILKYFGETYALDNCKACDICLRGNMGIAKRNFAKETYMLLRTINFTGNIYGGGMIISVLRGSDAKKIPPSFKKFEFYGKGKINTDKWWKILITLLITQRYISEILKNGARAPSLMVSPKGKEWLGKYTQDTTLIMVVPPAMENNPNPIQKSKISPTCETIKTLVSQGESVANIANTLNIAITSVENLICEIYKQGDTIDVNLLGFTDEIYQIVSKKMDSLEQIDNLKDIKNGLPKTITTLQIKLSIIKKNQEMLTLLDYC